MFTFSDIYVNWQPWPIVISSSSSSVFFYSDFEGGEKFFKRFYFFFFFLPKLSSFFQKLRLQVPTSSAKSSSSRSQLVPWAPEKSSFLLAMESRWWQCWCYNSLLQRPLHNKRQIKYFKYESLDRSIDTQGKNINGKTSAKISWFCNFAKEALIRMQTLVQAVVSNLKGDRGTRKQDIKVEISRNPSYFIVRK